MKKMLKGLALTLAAAGAIGVPAFALAHGGRFGKLSPEEREERRAQMLAKYDADKDGQLSDAEREAARRDFATERFKTLDTNKDGVLTFEEFLAGHHGRGHRGPRQ